MTSYHLPFWLRIAVFQFLWMIVPDFPLWATDIAPVSQKDLIQKAELIFEGTVVDIQYRSSDAIKGGNGVPHTFVTFRIHKVFKGNPPPGGQITLRFTGGPRGKSHILMIPGVPLFNRGERGILFARGNTVAICPLVGWSQGRFRIVDGMMYSDGGHELLRTSSGNLLLGASRKLKEVDGHAILGHRLARNQSSETGEAKSTLRGEQGERLTYEAFSDHLARLIKELVPKAELSKLPRAKNADANASFPFTLRAVAPPAADKKQR